MAFIWEPQYPVFGNHRKSRIQHFERSELRLQLIKNDKNRQFGEFFDKQKLVVKKCYQTD